MAPSNFTKLMNGVYSIKKACRISYATTDEGDSDTHCDASG